MPKTLSAAWQEFAADTAHITPVDRVVFYSGAKCMFDLISAVTDNAESDEPTPEELAAIDALHAELEAFRTEMVGKSLKRKRQLQN